MYSLRLASTGSTRLGSAFGRNSGGGAALGVKRSVSATPRAAAPVPGDQDLGMDPAKQPHPPPPHTPEGKQQVDKHTAKGDVMTDSFGEGYSTRADEEGFGGVYGQNDPEDDTSQESEVKEKEKAHGT